MFSESSKLMWKWFWWRHSLNVPHHKLVFIISAPNDNNPLETLLLLYLKPIFWAMEAYLHKHPRFTKALLIVFVEAAIRIFRLLMIFIRFSEILFVLSVKTSLVLPKEDFKLFCFGWFMKWHWCIKLLGWRSKKRSILAISRKWEFFEFKFCATSYRTFLMTFWMSDFFYFPIPWTDLLVLSSFR